MKKIVILITLIVLLISGCKNGSKKRVIGQPYTEYEGTAASGVKKIYNVEGNLETEVPYKDSLPNGIQKEYYKTGKLYRETPLLNGKANGLVKEYYTSGKIYREMPVTNGRADGIVKKYYENGSLLSEAPFVNGEPAVGLKEYNENGVMLETPKMIFRGIDNTVSEGCFYVEISFSDQYVKPTYFNVVNFEGKELLNKISIVNGKGIFKISSPKGALINKTLTFEARYNTIRKNIYVTRGTYAIGFPN
jgi:antitoxin component YwqK of YwqJK toxin-antitoxin module